MACGCQGTPSGQYEVVVADGTVPAQIGARANSFATRQDAQAALTSQSTGGFVRAKRAVGV
jgi:hypothetical protein